MERDKEAGKGGPGSARGDLGPLSDSAQHFPLLGLVTSHSSSDECVPTLPGLHKDLKREEEKPVDASETALSEKKDS